MTNERAQAWLESRGFNADPEPAWILQGEKPDFFVSGPAEAWIEVKTTGWENPLGDAMADLADRCNKLKTVGTGSIHAQIQTYEPKAAKQALHYAREASLQPSSDRIRVIMIPGDPAYGASVEFEYLADTSEVVCQTGPASASGEYQCYPALDAKNWSGLVTVERSNGDTDTAKQYQRLLSRIPFLISLRIFPSEKRLFVGSAGSGVRTSMGQKRVREHVNKANSQIRNGQKVRAAPGIVTIYHDNMDALDPARLITALFGDMSIPVTIVKGQSPRYGEAQFGPNAVLTARKNRGVAAVRYYGLKGDPQTVINPYANPAIDWRPFADTAWVIDEAQGKFLLTGR